MVTFAGEIPNLTTIKERWAPGYQYAIGANAVDVSTLTASSFQNYTGQISTTITVSSTGILMVIWGFEGHNNATTGSSLRLGINMSGANTVAADININAMVSNNGTTGAANRSTARCHLYTGLTPGVTVVKTQAYISSVPAVGSGRDAAMDNQYLFVSQFY